MDHRSYYHGISENVALGFQLSPFAKGPQTLFIGPSTGWVQSAVVEEDEGL